VRLTLVLKLGLVLVLSSSAFCGQKLIQKPIIERLSQEDEKALDLLFQRLLQHTSMGYVLFGEKPVFTWGMFSRHDAISRLGNPLHQNSIYLKKGFQVLKKLPINQPDSGFLLIENSGFYKGWDNIWLIHKEHLVKVFNENKMLFQYVLGPSISAKALLEALQKPNASLEKILRGDRVLIGIILGYGTENALVVSRKEYLSEYIQKQSIPLNLKRTVHDFSKGFYRDTGEDPSFGYANIKEENGQLANKGSVTIFEFPEYESPKLPWFGFLPTAKSKELIEGYKKTHPVIQQHLASPNLVETVLANLVPKDCTYAPPKQVQIAEEKVGYKIGQAIYQNLIEDGTKEEVSAFLEGMKAREEKNTKPLELMKAGDLYIAFSEKHKKSDSIKNLEFANKTFEQLEAPSTAVTKLKPGIYVRTVWKGKGPELTTQDSEVILTLFVRSLRGKTLVSRISSTYKLLEIDKALSYSLLGMKEGEERKIYLHPEAVESIDLTKTEGFIVTAALEKIISQKKAPHSIPVKQDLRPLLKAKEATKKAAQEASHAFYFEKGVAAWDHYKKLENQYSFQEVFQGIKDAAKGVLIDVSNPSFEKFLIDIHWKIYSANERASPEPVIAG